MFEKGRLVELEPTATIFADPKHAYTRRLIGAVPVVTAEEAALREPAHGERAMQVPDYA